MIELNNVVLQEFAKRGLSINEGIPAASIEALGRRAVVARSVSQQFQEISKCTWYMPLKAFQKAGYILGKQKISGDD